MYEEKTLRSKSPSRHQLSRESRSNSAERKGMLVKRKSTKTKEQLTKGNLFVPNTTTTSSNTADFMLQDKLHASSTSPITTCSDNNSTDTESCPCNDNNNDNKQTNKHTKSTKSKNISKTSALFDAVIDNDFTLLRSLIFTDDFNVDEVNVEGSTGLHFAAAAGHLECMQMLIDCGSRVCQMDDHRRTPLEYAVLYGNFECASLLIENGADASVIKDGILL
jgi:ankyrin repeat protein